MTETTKSSNLVARLRERFTLHGVLMVTLKPLPLELQAADEIERLTRELAIGKDWWSGLSSENQRLRMALSMDAPWPLPDVLEKLIEAVEHLLATHSCDTHGYEGYQIAIACGKAILVNLRLGLAKDHTLSLEIIGGTAQSNAALAKEIERLNKIADDLAALAKRHIAEKAKLRAALEKIVNAPDVNESPHVSSNGRVSWATRDLLFSASALRKIAHEALRDGVERHERLGVTSGATAGSGVGTLVPGVETTADRGGDVP